METIPLPRDRIRDKLPVNIEVGNIDAWPGQRFRLRLDWNTSMKRWVVRITHVETDTTFARSPVSLMRSYEFDPYISFIFFDPSNEADKVSAENLGRTVKLGAFPLGDNV